MTRYALAAACAALVALGGSSTALAAAPPPADVQTPATDVFTGETATALQTPASLATCTAPRLASVLSSLGDRRSYFSAPGGDFESGLDGWQLAGGAARVAGNEPWRVLGSAHGSSLRLPPGSSAITPTFCIDLDYPTFRFFAAQLQSKADAELQVDVFYPDVAKRNVRQAETVKGDKPTTWTLAKDVDLKPTTAGKARGWRRVALRFRVPATSKGADWRVDDVVVDPRCRF